MKVLTIGDPHFKVNNVQECEEMTQKLVELAQRIQPTFIVCLGDILHKHESIHVVPLMRAENLIKRLSEIALTFLIVGNHDRPNNSNYLTDEHPFNAMKEWKNVYIADKVLDVTIQEKRFLLVPYVPPGRFMDALQTKENPLIGTTAIFAHQEFHGAKMGAIKSQAGDKWPLNNPHVISGHIHDYDKLQSNITYVGTPMQHAFGDSTNKTVSIFTFDETISDERIDLGLTKRVIIYLSPDQIHTYEPPTDKLVKIVIRGEDAEIKAIGSLDKIKELRRQGVKVVFKANISEESTQKIRIRLPYRDRLLHEISSDPDQVKWYKQLF